MNEIADNLNRVQQRIHAAERLYGRPFSSVQLLAVSKAQPLQRLAAALEAGQRCFGESYLQEALGKIEVLAEQDIEWHFIGRLQGNKTRAVAEHFAWVHSLFDLRHARRLHEQRPPVLGPLNVCIQVNISREPGKSGLMAEETEDFIRHVRELARLKVCGLMCIPRQETDLDRQRAPFRALRELRDRLASPELPLDTLSMGMSGDLEAAIAEGSNLVRVGTAVFGPRPTPDT